VAEVRDDDHVVPAAIQSRDRSLLLEVAGSSPPCMT